MVVAAAKESFHGFSQRTVYRLVNSGLPSVGRPDLIQACSRRPRQGKYARTVTKTDAKCRVGRTHEEYLAFQALGGKTPYDEFVSFHGARRREFLEKFGIRRVVAESVVLDPILLGEKFKKEANRAILHRHGFL